MISLMIFYKEINNIELINKKRNKILMINIWINIALLHPN